MQHTLAKITSSTIIGLDAVPIEVEVDVSPGLHFFHIVGLPDKSVQESRDRIESAIKNSGFKPPKSQNLKVVVNLAPADVKKEGSLFDLPIALGYLIASGQLRAEVSGSIFIGELALDGSIRRSKGVLPIALFAKGGNFKALIISRENELEASVVNFVGNNKNSLQVISVNNLGEIISILSGKIPVPKASKSSLQLSSSGEVRELDIDHIQGQSFAKRGLEIAAAGGHNILMVGRQGSGKTMLARALASILPPMSLKESLEVTKIHSVAGLLHPDENLVRERPFRSPHHTISAIALVGGGTHPKPGEISLAHRGVLFLDELPEFGRYATESLRQPLEDGKINVSRVSGSIAYPARFQLVSAMNPCPCGNFGDSSKACICGPSAALKYQKRISGPLLDRIDIQLKVLREKVSPDQIKNSYLPGEEIRNKVNKARFIQQNRFELEGVFTNSEMSNQQVKKFCHLATDPAKFLDKFIDYKMLSMRSYYRIIKIARTIADLSESKDIGLEHIAEASRFRADESLFDLA